MSKINKNALFRFSLVKILRIINHCPYIRRLKCCRTSLSQGTAQTSTLLLYIHPSFSTSKKYSRDKKKCNIAHGIRIRRNRFKGKDLSDFLESFHQLHACYTSRFLFFLPHLISLCAKKKKHTENVS